MTEVLAKAQLGVGDVVRIVCGNEGYGGQIGTIAAVFPSGRCQIAVGNIVLLNLPPEGFVHEVSN